MSVYRTIGPLVLMNRPLVLMNQRDFFHQPVLPHISVDAPTIRNEKKFDTIIRKASRTG